MVMQKDEFENERLNRLNLPFEQQIICLQYLLSRIRIRHTKRIYAEIRHGCCNFDVEDRFSIQFKKGLKGNFLKITNQMDYTHLYNFAQNTNSI